MSNTHETLNSLGVLLAILVSVGSFYLAWEQRQQAKESISVLVDKPHGGFNASISQTGDSNYFDVRVSYRLLVSNLSSMNTSIVSVRSFKISRDRGGTYYDEAYNRSFEPIYLEAGETKSFYADVIVPIKVDCFFHELKALKNDATLSDVVKVFGARKRSFPACLDLNPKTSGEPSVTPSYAEEVGWYDYADTGPVNDIAFQVSTARGSTYVAYTSSASLAATP